MASTSLDINDTNNDNTGTVNIQHVIHRFESDYYTSRQIAMLRIRLLCNSFTYNKKSTNIPVERSGLAAIFLPVLTEAVREFVEEINWINQSFQRLRYCKLGDEHIVEFYNRLNHLRRLLVIYLRWVQNDSTLAEEFGRQGSHLLLVVLIQLSILPPSTQELAEDRNDVNPHLTDTLVDCLEDIQDLAGEIAASSRPHFPLKTIEPYTINELRERLPLIFTFHLKDTLSLKVSEQTISRDIIQVATSDEKIDQVPVGDVVTAFIHQINSRQSAQVDVGFGESI
jgi:hypothetical protein